MFQLCTKDNSNIKTNNLIDKIDINELYQDLRSVNEFSTDVFKTYDRVVLIVVEPTDCSTCLDFLSRLNTIYSDYKSDISIVGVVSTPYNLAAKQLFERYNVKFPFFHDASGNIKLKLVKSETIPMKPILMLIDRGDIKMSSIIGSREYLQSTREILNIFKRE